METVNNNNYKQLKFKKAKLRRTRTHYSLFKYIKIYRRWWPQQADASQPTPTQKKPNNNQPNNLKSKQTNKKLSALVYPVQVVGQPYPGLVDPPPVGVVPGADDVGETQRHVGYPALLPLPG